MARVDYRIGVADDRSFVRIETAVDGEVKAWSHTSAPELEAVIEIFADARMQLADEVPREIDPGTRIRAVDNPAVRMQRSPQTNGILLALRHPGIGWTSFHLPEEEARRFVSDLAALLPE